MRGKRRTTAPTSSVKISIVLPLFDCRTAGWRSLESALAQSHPRDAYEVIAVTGRTREGAAHDATLDALLARCDVVVRTDLDADDVTNETALYAAGHAQASGDLLLFMEGHTALEPDCCRVIDRHFRRHASSALAWAPRRNHGTTPLGRLVSLHNLRHERRASAHGTFSLGANSVIRRDLFARLGGFDPRYQRFGETAILHRARAEGIGVDRIDVPLATHFNDMDVRHWRMLVMQMGDAKAGYYDALRARGEDLRAHVRHPIYLAVGTRWRARVLLPLFGGAGTVFLALAMRALAASDSIASTLYIVAIGCTDLAGYCRARARATADFSA